MAKWIKNNSKSKDSNRLIYNNCIDDLIKHEKVLSMSKYIQHNDINCLEHCLYVSYYSFLISKQLGFDYKSVARGALLHDFFLYDWHDKNKNQKLHGPNHPNLALENANKYFELNELEKDIIKKHMWPLTLKFPRYKEAFIVVIIDKYCATLESLRIIDGKKLRGFREELFRKE